MSEADLERLGLLADRLDNAAAATFLPISPILAVDCMKGVIEVVSAEIKAFLIERGFNPWEDQP
jgi:hypothetical protein